MNRLFLTLAFVCTTAAFAQQKSGITPERLQEYLKQYPDADTNKDGILGMDEARAYLQKMRGDKPGKAKTTDAALVPPTYANVKYGPHERNVLDFYKAESAKPTPVVVFIHGGGFVSGDKSKGESPQAVKPYLAAGISYACINYRYRTSAPIQDVLRDCARAIQFIRVRSNDWNVDKTKLASHGGSAGAGTSLWLAFHDDMADPANADPVLRESTRLVCAGATATQFSYDVIRWPELLGEEVSKKYGDSTDAPGFYGFKTMEELLSPAGLKIRSDCDMCGLISKDDPPVFLSIDRDAGPITDRGAYLHHPLHSKAIYDRCHEIGVPVIADAPGLKIKPPADGPTQIKDFLIRQLLGHL